MFLSFILTFLSPVVVVVVAMPSVVFQQPTDVNAINSCGNYGQSNAYQCPNVLFQSQVHNPVLTLPVQKSSLFTPITHKTVIAPTAHKPLIIPHIHKTILRPPIIPKPIVIPVLPKALISPIQDAILPIKVIPFFQRLLNLFSKSIGLQTKSNYLPAKTAYLQPVSIPTGTLDNIDYPKLAMAKHQPY